jgi:hypothetical protein
MNKRTNSFPLSHLEAVPSDNLMASILKPKLEVEDMVSLQIMYLGFVTASSSCHSDPKFVNFRINSN